MTTVTDINNLLSLKSTLVSQINADDTVANIQTTLNSIASQKVTILAGQATSTVLDDGSGVTTPDRLNYIQQSGFSKYNDTELFMILISWFLRTDGQLQVATNPTIISDLMTKENQITTIIKDIVPLAQLNFIKFIASH